MPYYDISRVNYDPKKHYTSVRLQQGRVLDSDDWNELERMDKELLRRTKVDIIGPYGTPDNGFNIVNPYLLTGNLINFEIEPGSIYLGGHRIDLETRQEFRYQSDGLQLLPTHFGNLNGIRQDMVYLEVWQQGVSAVEDEALFERALGGPDTSTRVRNFWQVKVFPDVNTRNCEVAWESFKLSNPTINEEHERVTDAKLTVSFSTNIGPGQDLCAPSGIAGYLGAENQAIRIQLTGPDTFTWGFNNAAPLYRAEFVDDSTIKLLTAPKDAYHWPSSNKVVEILPWSAVLPNGEHIADECGHLTRVSTVNPDPEKMEFSIINPITPHQDFGKVWGQTTPAYIYVRFWERDDNQTGTPHISFTPGTSVNLGNTGLAVTFSGTQFHKADHWVIAARPETPDLVVPWDLLTGASPHGVRRFFAPLAIIEWADQGGPEILGQVVHDCRPFFWPLTHLSGCCINVHPRMNLQGIIDQIPKGQDICLCFGQGTYTTDQPIVIIDKGNVTLKGCGKGSLVHTTNAESAVFIENCKDVSISDMAFLSSASGEPRSDNDPFRHLNGTLTIHGCHNILIQHICASCTFSTTSRRQAAAITIKHRGGERNILSTTIRDSEIIVGNNNNGILVVNPQKLIIENNNVYAEQSISLKVPAIGFQGIVVGGAQAQEVLIQNNLITKFIQGIHVGMSDSKTGRDIIFSSNCIRIIGNKVFNTVPQGFNGERHGIFVGNSDSTIVKDNYVEFQRSLYQKDFIPINGIRLYGKFGKRILIKDNYLNGYNYLDDKKDENIDLYVKYINSKVNYPLWWIISGNVAHNIKIDGVGRPFRTTEMTYADGWRYL
jgi:hypothetical protein